MPAKKPAAPPPKPMTRPEWCFAFVDALVRIRTGLGSKYMNAIAIHQYDPMVDPVVAAKQWTERQR